MPNPPKVSEKGAIFSENKLFRYVLWRKTGNDSIKTIVFIMLNPSTADENTDDPTIRRCINFARQWGFGTLRVLNLYAFRATDPKDMLRAEDPVGPENLVWLRKESYGADRVICAWGVNAARSEYYDQIITSLRSRFLYCLGKTKDGHPRHPLYVKGDTEPIPFTV
jgi:hypothetical protein